MTNPKDLWKSDITWEDVVLYLEGDLSDPAEVARIERARDETPEVARLFDQALDDFSPPEEVITVVQDMFRKISRPPTVVLSRSCRALRTYKAPAVVQLTPWTMTATSVFSLSNMGVHDLLQFRRTLPGTTATVEVNAEIIDNGKLRVSLALGKESSLSFVHAGITTEGQQCGLRALRAGEQAEVVGDFDVDENRTLWVRLQWTDSGQLRDEYYLLPLEVGD